MRLDGREVDQGCVIITRNQYSLNNLSHLLVPAVLDIGRFAVSVPQIGIRPSGGDARRDHAGLLSVDRESGTARSASASHTLVAASGPESMLKTAWLPPHDWWLG